MSTYTKMTPVFAGWPFIFLLSAIGLLLGVVLSFVRPLEYSSTMRLLVTQPNTSTDAYTAVRASEAIAEDLASIIYSSVFFESVLASAEGFDLDYFPESEHKFRKQWGEAVVASVSRSSGMLTLRAYHTDVDQAQILVETMANVMMNEGWQFTSGSDISVNIIDHALNSRWPVRPNVLVNGFSGMLLGMITSIGYILIQTERLRRRHQLIHED